VDKSVFQVDTVILEEESLSTNPLDGVFGIALYAMSFALCDLEKNRRCAQCQWPDGKKT